MNDLAEIADVVRLLNAALDDTGERRQRLLEQALEIATLLNDERLAGLADWLGGA